MKKDPMWDGEKYRGRVTVHQIKHLFRLFYGQMGEHRAQKEALRRIIERYEDRSGYHFPKWTIPQLVKDGHLQEWPGEPRMMQITEKGLYLICMISK